MPFLVGAGVAAILGIQMAPALWVQPNGRITIDGETVKPRLLPGTQLRRMNGITAYDFNGVKAGILFGDAAPLRLTGSITIAVWMNLRSYVNDGPGAQVLFRGDDRCGHDPYFMAIHRDGTVNFAIQNEHDQGRSVTAELGLNRWHHVLAHFDEREGRLEMWLDGKLAGLAYTVRRPFANLDKGQAPGVSIGNVQNDAGPHNQPLNGLIADLRLYRGAFRPQDLELGLGGWSEPPRK